MDKWIVVMKIQPSICLDDWGKPRKTPVRLVGTGIWTTDLPNASLVRYRSAPVVLYGCETWSFTLRKQQKLRVFKNKVLSKILGAKIDMGAKIHWEFRISYLVKNPDGTDLTPAVNFFEARRSQLAKSTLLNSTLLPLGSSQIF